MNNLRLSKITQVFLPIAGYRSGIKKNPTEWIAAIIGIGLILTSCTSTTESEPDLSLKPINSSAHSSSEILDIPAIDNDTQTIEHGERGKGGKPEATLIVDVKIVGNSRSRTFVESAMTEVSDIYQQCKILVSSTISSIAAEPAIGLKTDQLYRLSQQHAHLQPTVFVIDSTEQRDVAFSYLPSLDRDVSGTAWISNRVSDRCFAWIVAHEIGHIALDSDRHHPDKRNVMTRQCSSNNNFNRITALPRWDDEQCALVRQYVTIHH